MKNSNDASTWLIFHTILLVNERLWQASFRLNWPIENNVSHKNYMKGAVTDQNLYRPSVKSVRALFEAAVVEILFAEVVNTFPKKLQGDII